MAPEVPGYASSPRQGDLLRPSGGAGSLHCPGQGNLGLEQWTHLALGDWCLAPLGQKTWGRGVMEQGDWSKLRVGWSIREPHTS